MALITKPKTWATGEAGVAANDLNADFDALYQVINGGIDDTNLSNTAQINESKISWDTVAGHDHDGVNSKEIVTGGLAWSVQGALFVLENYLHAGLIQLDKQRTLKNCRLIVDTPPTGAEIIVDVLLSTDNGATYTSLWNINSANRPKILTDTRTAIVTEFDTSLIPADGILKMKVVQVGSDNPGADLTVELF